VRFKTKRRITHTMFSVKSNYQNYSCINYPLHLFNLISIFIAIKNSQSQFFRTMYGVKQDYFIVFSPSKNVMYYLLYIMFLTMPPNCFPTFWMSSLTMANRKYLIHIVFHIIPIVYQVFVLVFTPRLYK